MGGRVNVADALHSSVLLLLAVQTSSNESWAISEHAVVLRSNALNAPRDVALVN